MYACLRRTRALAPFALAHSGPLWGGRPLFAAARPEPSFVLLRWIPSSRWGRQPLLNSICIALRFSLSAASALHIFPRIYIALGHRPSRHLPHRIRCVVFLKLGVISARGYIYIIYSLRAPGPRASAFVAAFLPNLICTRFNINVYTLRRSKAPAQRAPLRYAVVPASFRTVSISDTVRGGVRCSSDLQTALISFGAC